MYSQYFMLNCFFFFQNIPDGTVVVVIVWWLNLQLRVQSVPITTKVVSLNRVHVEMYTRCNIM